MVKYTCKNRVYYFESEDHLRSALCQTKANPDISLMQYCVVAIEENKVVKCRYENTHKIVEKLFDQYLRLER